MATEFKLVASDIAVEFGRTVAVSGDYAIVGANQGSPTSLVSPGAAYIFVKGGTGWTQQAKLTATTAKDIADEFGCAVAIDGDYVLVGAKHDGAVWRGKAYIFHRNGSNWVQQSVLVPSDPVDSAEFGTSVALSADWAIVASTNDAAYLFQRSGSTWNQQKKLTGFNSVPAVSLNGDYAVVGAFNPGSAHVFKRTGATWQQQAVITPSDPASLNYFGWSVSISGDYLIVGAWGANAAYIFVRNGSIWTQQAKLEPIPGTQGGTALFGQSVAISGGYTVVGDTSDNEVAPGSGAAYVFQRKGMAWPLAEKVIASDASPGAWFDSFGSSVAIDGAVAGGRALVGAADKGNGAAYVLSGFTAGMMVDASKYSIYAKILFGLTGGGGGVIWLPGVGPVPIDPEPFKAWSTLSPTKRDVLVGLALSEIANLIHDGKVRQDVKRAGVKLAKQAASQLRLPSEIETR
jgi:hypothetical protein